MTSGEFTGGSQPGRSSDDYHVARPQAGLLPQKRGELGWDPSAEGSNTQETRPSVDQLPARHPADRSTPIPPSVPAPATTNRPSTTSAVSSRPLNFKSFLRSPRRLGKIHGVQPAIVLRLVLVSLALTGSIIGWAVTVTHMNSLAKNNTTYVTPSPSPAMNSSASSTIDVPGGSFDQMTQSSLVFVHVAFGAAIFFQFFVLERAVYRFRAERYAFLHPNEIPPRTSSSSNPAMAFAPWNRPSLPTYAAALGIRGTGDVEDNMIAGPPPPEYGNTRGSTLILTSRFPTNPNSRLPPTPHSTGSRLEPPSPHGRSSQLLSPHSVRDALGRPIEAWSRPVSYGEDEMRENARRSLDLETALARLEGSASDQAVTRPAAAVMRR